MLTGQRLPLSRPADPQARGRAARPAGAMSRRESVRRDASSDVARTSIASRSASTTRTPMPPASSTTPTICASPSGRAPSCMREAGADHAGMLRDDRAQLRRAPLRDRLSEARAARRSAGGGDPHAPMSAAPSLDIAADGQARRRGSGAAKVKLACLNRPAGRRGCRSAMRAALQQFFMPFFVRSIDPAMATDLRNSPRTPPAPTQSVPIEPVHGGADRAARRRAAAGHRSASIFGLVGLFCRPTSSSRW